MGEIGLSDAAPEQARRAAMSATGEDSGVTTHSDGLDTFPRLLDHNAAHRGDRPASREKAFGIWQSWTWAAVREEVRALAMGCGVLAAAPGAGAALAALAAVAPVVCVEGGLPADLRDLAIDCAAYDGPAPERALVRAMLAARETALTPLITAADPASAFAVERVVSIDTTAAGGDAALLAAAA